jgi:hypothetical protein
MCMTIMGQGHRGHIGGAMVILAALLVLRWAPAAWRSAFVVTLDAGLFLPGRPGS